MLQKLMEKEDGCRKLTDENVEPRLKLADLARTTNANTWHSFHNVHDAENDLNILVIADFIVQRTP